MWRERPVTGTHVTVLALREEGGSGPSSYGGSFWILLLLNSDGISIEVPLVLQFSLESVSTPFKQFID